MFLRGSPADAITFRVKPEMAPKIGVVVFFLQRVNSAEEEGGLGGLGGTGDATKRRGVEVISDHLVLSIKPCFANPVEFSWRSKEPDVAIEDADEADQVHSGSDQ